MRFWRDFARLGSACLVRKGEVPEVPTKRETISSLPLLLAPVLGVLPFWVEVEGGESLDDGVAVARVWDILVVVVLWEGVRFRSRSVMIFASADERRGGAAAPFVWDEETEGDCASGDCGREELALGLEKD
jgi:hypothetical protein